MTKQERIMQSLTSSICSLAYIQNSMIHDVTIQNIDSIIPMVHECERITLNLTDHIKALAFVAKGLNNDN